MRLVNVKHIHAHLIEAHVLVLPFARHRCLELFFQLLDAVLDVSNLRAAALFCIAGIAFCILHLFQRGAVIVQLLVHHLVLELWIKIEQLEGGVRNNDAIQVGHAHARDEAAAVVGVELLLVGHHQPGGRVKLQPFLRELLQHVVRHHHHRLADHAQALLLHARDHHFPRLAAPDRVRQIGVAGLDDAPCAALDVIEHADRCRRARQSQVATVELARYRGVELVVVERDQLLGALVVLPHPIGKRLTHLLQLLDGSLGSGRLKYCRLRIRVFGGDADCPPS